MTAPITKSCQNCDAFWPNSQDMKIGECRAKEIQLVPTVSERGLQIVGAFPVTKRENWCRMFIPRGEKQ